MFSIINDINFKNPKNQAVKNLVQVTQELVNALSKNGANGDDLEFLKRNLNILKNINNGRDS